MKDMFPFNEFVSQDALKELVGHIANSDIKSIGITGLFGSSKSITVSASINEGVNIIVMDNKEEAQFLTNDLYSMMDEESVYFFPCSSNISQSKISTIKDSSQKVQRSAAISSLNSATSPSTFVFSSSDT